MGLLSFPQAEAWIQEKLRNLGDGCSLADREEVTQAVQRDLKDFENTLIQLNQVRVPPAQICFNPLPCLMHSELKVELPTNPAPPPLTKLMYNTRVPLGSR